MTLLPLAGSLSPLSTARKRGYPISTTEMALWLRSDTNLYQSSGGTTSVTADNDPVGYVGDVQNNGVYAYQNIDTSKRPLYKTGILNGYPALRFDGANDSLLVPNIALDAFFTMFVVARTTTAKPLFIEHGANVNTTDGFYIYGSNSDTLVIKRFVLSIIDSAAGWLGGGNSIISGLYAGSMPEVRKNGTAQSGIYRGSAVSDTAFTGNLNIFSRNQTAIFSEGDLFELILYNRELSTGEQNEVGAYLAARYSLSWAT